MLRLNQAMAGILVAIGVAALVETAVQGGGQLGVLVGLAFIALGALRWRAFGRR